MDSTWSELRNDLDQIIGALDADGNLDLLRDSGAVIRSTLAAWRDTATAYIDPQIRIDGSDLHYLDEVVPVRDPRGGC
ncbi:hypothetical protein [Nocardia sp. NPDC052566]|uniref:hypothetical protein n=1 Tax=Nocardia sp. NPDC052566 TaxID=3364330 RepID=UPI0037C82E40